MKGAKPDIPGTSSPDPTEKSFFNIEVRFLYGKRKVKYVINQPGATLMIDYDFSAISYVIECLYHNILSHEYRGLAFKVDTKIMIVELAEAPTFSAREESKWVKVIYPSSHLKCRLTCCRFWISHTEMLPITNDTTLNSMSRTFHNMLVAYLNLIPV